MCNIMETAGRRAKRTKICDSGTLVTHMLCSLDLIVFWVILGSLSVLVSKWPRKRLVERNGVKCETGGY